MIPRVKWVPFETPYVGVPGTNTVLVDATGVGAPVIEMLTASGLLGRPAPVMVPRGQNMGLMKGAETVPRRALLGACGRCWRRGCCGLVLGWMGGRSCVGRWWRWGGGAWEAV